MTIATKRACRDCGALLGRRLEQQCSDCVTRTEWRPLRGWPEPIVIEVPAKAPQSSRSDVKLPSCQPGKHAACKHYQRLVSKLIEEHEDAGMCFVCGGEWDDTLNRIPHKTDCELLPLDPLPPPGGAAGEEG